MKPKVCILRTDGTNCDNELYYAFNVAGADPSLVHINELRNKTKSINDFQILAIPGGFSYGDDIVSGKILAVELISFLKKDLEKFVKDKKIILGVCNGFQVLVRSGLLPFNNFGSIDATLIDNDSDRFECRWIKVITNQSVAKCFDELGVLEMAVNHGEGKFLTSKNNIKKLKDNKQIIFQYVDNENNITMDYPDNPNGSIEAIAGICDPTGRIIGLMPHPEKFIELTQHPDWRNRDSQEKPDGLNFFQRIVKSANDYEK